MAYSEEIDRRIVGLVADWHHVERRKMFGGTCHLLGGHMFCGVSGNELILRLGADRAGQCLKEDTVSEFDITGTPMKGWVVVSEQGFLTDKEVEQWLVMAREFVLSLPAKNK
jgi:TfoX/Sxy family transcriptional regulator of competence genes